MDKVLMPKELTAENGAKALLTGEFFEETEIDGSVLLDEDGDPGRLTLKVPVSWTTIKEIYKMAVDNLAGKPAGQPHVDCYYFGGCGCNNTRLGVKPHNEQADDVSLSETIRVAQVEAGEQSVLHHLKRLGF